MPLVYMTGKINDYTDRYKHLHSHDLPLGVLVQPLTIDYLDKARLYEWVGIDNGCFSEVGRRKFVLRDYLDMIRRALWVSKQDGVLFATAPDEPFNWEETLRKSLPILPLITEIGIAHQKRMDPPGTQDGPYYNLAAIVVQNGATPDTVPWDLIGTVFIGGDDEFKLGPAAHAIVKAAHKQRKHVHMGRVNSMKRMLLCQRWGVDSADGTYLCFTDPHEGSADILEWLREQWKRYHCNWCGIRNTHCICGGIVERITRDEINARYAIPHDMPPHRVKAFIRQYIAQAQARRSIKQRGQAS